MDVKAGELPPTILEKLPMAAQGDESRGLVVLPRGFSTSGLELKCRILNLLGIINCIRKKTKASSCCF